MSNFTDFFPAAGGGGGGAIPDLVGLEYLILSGGGAGAGVSGAVYGGGGGGGGTLLNDYFYANKDTTIPVLVGAGGAYSGGTTTPGGNSEIGVDVNKVTILGGGGGTYSSAPTTGGTCLGGRGTTSGTSNIAGEMGYGFNQKGKQLGRLNDTALIIADTSINQTTEAHLNGLVVGRSGGGAAGLGGPGQSNNWQTGGTGGIGLDPTTVTSSFLTQAELQTELIGEVTTGTSYIGGGGTGYGDVTTNPRANPPGGCGRETVDGLANTGGGGGGLSSGGSGFTMIRVLTSQSVTTTGTPSTYTQGAYTIYVWKNTGSITINS
jgi:hypothetical protein